MSKFFTIKPDNFHCDVEVSTVFMECNHNILFLQRASHKTLAPSTWAVPGGKLEKEETPLEGLKREIQEELALYPEEGDLTYKTSFFVEHPAMRYRLHLFHWQLKELPKITLCPEEHQAFLWQPIEHVCLLPLLEGQLEAFHAIYSKAHS
jgi:8-oxo-dGTP diphosphatase